MRRQASTGVPGNQHQIARLYDIKKKKRTSNRTARTKTAALLSVPKEREGKAKAGRDVQQYRIRTEEAREARDGVRRRDEARVGVGEDLPAGVEEPLHGRDGRCGGVGGRGGLLVATAVLLGGGGGAGLVADNDGSGREVQHPGRPGVRHLAPSDLHRHVTVPARWVRSGQEAGTAGSWRRTAAGRAGRGEARRGSAGLGWVYKS